LNATKDKLAAQLEIYQAYIKKLKEEFADLNVKIKQASQEQRLAKSIRNEHYCCSYGYQVHTDHANATCKAKKDGHKDAATKDNTMDGVKWGT
jgi:hypothetical protein